MLFTNFSEKKAFLLYCNKVSKYHPPGLSVSGEGVCVPSVSITKIFGTSGRPPFCLEKNCFCESRSALSIRVHDPETMSVEMNGVEVLE